MELELLDHAFVALRAGRVADLRFFPIPDFDMHGTAKAIHVFDLADAADRQKVAVAGECQGTNAADRAFALSRIVSVKSRNLEPLCELARFNHPDTDRAVPIGAGQVFPIRSDGHDVE